MLKIRRPLGRLIFNMGIAIPGKTVFLIETAPCWLPVNSAHKGTEMPRAYRCHNFILDRTTLLILSILKIPLITHLNTYLVGVHLHRYHKSVHRAYIYIYNRYHMPIPIYAPCKWTGVVYVFKERCSINPCPTGLIWGNINPYLHFLIFLKKSSWTGNWNVFFSLMAMPVVSSITFNHVRGSFNHFMPTTGDVWKSPSFRIWCYVLPVEHVSCVITNWGQHQ